MAIKTNIKDKRPGREKFNKTIRLLAPSLVSAWFPSGEILVYPWDTNIDEWAAAHSQKASNLAPFMIEMVKKLTNLGQCPPQSFSFGDAMLILMVAKSLRNRGRFSIEPKCTHCHHINRLEEFSIPDDLECVSPKKLDYPGYDTIVLPDSEDPVSLRPMTLGDLLTIGNRTLLEKSTVSEIRASSLWNITEVGGGKPDSLEEVNNWYNSLSPSDQVFLHDSQKRLEPHLSETLTFECQGCKEEFSVELSLNSEFFRPRINPESGRAVA